MDAPVRIPLEFWKVCALIRDDGTLSATAFILSQDDITALPGFEAFLDVAEVQTTIRNVEQTHRPQVPCAARQRPPRRRRCARNARTRGQTVIPIRSYEDIVT